EQQGLHFIQAPEYVALPRPAPGMPAKPALADRVGTLVPILREVRPDVVVNDFFTIPAALAAESEGLRRATVVPHPYPVNEPGPPATSRWCSWRAAPPRTRSCTSFRLRSGPWRKSR